MELNKRKCPTQRPNLQTLNTLPRALTQSFPKCVQKTVYHTYIKDLLCVKLNPRDTVMNITNVVSSTLTVEERNK